MGHRTMLFLAVAVFATKSALTAPNLTHVNVFNSGKRD